VQEARDLAMQARARAEEARRFATQKTAAATALTIHAKEILDVAVTVKGGSMGGGRGSRSVSSNSAPDVLSERMGRGIAGAAASGDISSPPFTPAAGHKRARSFAIQPPTRKALKPAAPAPAPAAAVSSSGRLKKTPQKYIVADDDTDMEDFYEPPVTKAAAATAAAVVAAAAAVEAEVEAAAATESVEAAAAAAAMVPKPGGKSGGTKKSRAAAQVGLSQITPPHPGIYHICGPLHTGNISRYTFGADRLSANYSTVYKQPNTRVYPEFTLRFKEVKHTL